MKKTLLTVSLLLVCCWFCIAQTYDWVWARSAPGYNGNGGGEGTSIATDKSNNVYIIGCYSGTIRFGSFILTSASSTTFYLAKYDSYGNVKWAKSAVNGSGGFIYGNNVCVDIFGNAYATGYFDGTVSFGSHTITSAGNDDIFFVKYDSTGNVLWAKRAGGTNNDGDLGVSTDRSGNVYLTGYFSSTTITFGSYTLTNAGSSDIFLTKYDSSGNVLWAKRAGGSSNDIAYSIATDALANVYVTGYFASPSITFGFYTLTNTGGNDVFLAKYDSLGNVLWAKRAGNSSDDEGRYVAADSSGNAYLTGHYFSAPISFGSFTLTNAGSNDAFLVKYDSSGNVRWAKGIGGTGPDKGYCVTTDKSLRTYITGGFYSSSLTFDTITVQRPAVYQDPMYVAGYDSAGHVLFAKALSSGSDDQNAVAASPSGCIYVGGDFYQVSPFIIGNDSLYLSGIEDPFVAKLCYSNLTASFNSSDSSLCAEGNICINFFDHSTGNPTSWQWHFTGATPDTSTQQNPINICYSAPGTYPVSLVVKNLSGSDSLTVASMIIVASPPLPPIVTVVGGDTLHSSHGSHYQWYLNGVVIAGATDSFYVAHQGGTYSVQVTDQYGCHSLSYGTQVGIDELSGGVGVAVYPNPFQNELTASPPAPLPNTSGQVQRRGEWEFTLFDVTSRELLRRSFSQQATINTEHLARGIYFYEVTNKGGLVIRGKLVKQ